MASFLDISFSLVRRSYFLFARTTLEFVLTLQRAKTYEEGKMQNKSSWMRMTGRSGEFYMLNARLLFQSTCSQHASKVAWLHDQTPRITI